MGLKILIVGFGSIAKRHYDILVSNFDISVVDVLSKQNIKNAYGKVYAHFEEINRLDIYDYFIIANETGLHYEIFNYIESRVANKVILLEKPVFSSFQDYSDLGDFKNNIYVAYNLRFHPVMIQLKNFLSDKDRMLYTNIYVGQYLPTWRKNRDYRSAYSSNLRQGGGVLHDLSHELDYVQWLFGNINLDSVKSVNAKVSNLEIQADDVACLVGRTINGGVINISMDYLSHIHRRELFVHTNQFTISADIISGEIVIQPKDQPRITQKVEYDINDSYRSMHRSVLNLENVACTMNEGLSVLDIITTVERENYSDLRGFLNE